MVSPPLPRLPGQEGRNNLGHNVVRNLGHNRPIAASLSLPRAHVDLIEQSHQRCAALGLLRIERPDFAPLGRADLAQVRERNQRLHCHAAPVMEMLFEQIAGTQSMVVLCDASGTIIHSIGDDDFLSRASKVALQPGVNWAEQSKGTNAIGTALIEEVPTLVHADEHYQHANHFLTCSAAPILDPRGNILGALDVTADHRSYHQHTMGLVRMSARMIENHWLSDDYRDVMRLHFHSRPECIGTLMEGILAVSPDGRITGANRGALEQLGLSAAALRMQSLASLFSTTVAELVDRFRSPLATPLLVRTGSDLPVYVQARFNGPVWRDPAGGRPAGAVVGSAAEQPVEAVGAEFKQLPPGPALRPAAAVRDAGSAPGLGHLQTGDVQINALVGKVRRVLDRDIPMLLMGDSGTGKRMLARAIHQDSSRSRQPFVAVNCAAISPASLEAELLGFDEGAISGGRRGGAVGKILQAHGGTLYLAEVGELPLQLQTQLLRVLLERQVTPLGSGRSVPVDVSLICASQRNLRERIDVRAFREDLYYRLNGLAVKLPALRERSDLTTLVRRILDDQGIGRHLQLSPQVLQLFAHYHWPGNVRQLYNALRAAAVVAGQARVIDRLHLPDDFLEDATRCLNQQQAQLPGGTAPGTDGGGSLAALELQSIRAAVAAAGGNISAAAQRLGVSRNTIYRRLRSSREVGA